MSRWKKGLSLVVGLVGGLVGGALLAAGVLVRHHTAMPGRSWSGPLPDDPEIHALARRLEAHVEALAGEIGPRSTQRPEALEAAASYVEAALGRAGFDVRSRRYDAHGVPVRNLIVEIPGPSPELVIVGAHYDSEPGTPGADDNASGTAALIELAARLRDLEPHHTVQLVAFTNEECPHCGTPTMGSLRHASALAQDGRRVVAMLALESLGYYDDRPRTQHYPPPFSWLYPDRGDFVGFVGNLASTELTRRATGAFRAAGRLPSHGAAVPDVVGDAARSDHVAFWLHGWPALMVTDTAPFRNPHYHRPTDTPDRVDPYRLALVVEGLDPVVRALSTAPARASTAPARDRADSPGSTGP